MASSALKTTAFLVTLNLMFFTLVTSDQLQSATCPIDGLKLGVCANVLNDLLHGNILGTPSATSPCCDLFYGIVELEAAVCVCNAIKANLLGLGLNASVSTSLLLNQCGKGVPSGFQCA